MQVVLGRGRLGGKVTESSETCIHGIMSTTSAVAVSHHYNPVYCCHKLNSALCRSSSCLCNIIICIYRRDGGGGGGERDCIIVGVQAPRLAERPVLLVSVGWALFYASRHTHVICKAVCFNKTKNKIIKRSVVYLAQAIHIYVSHGATWYNIDLAMYLK